MFSKNRKSNKFMINIAIKAGFLFLMALSIHKITLAAGTPTDRQISIDKNPVLISDSLKKIDAKLVIKSSLDKLSENIYFSSLNNYFSLYMIIDRPYGVNKNTKLLEVLALREFYSGHLNKAEQLLSNVFETTTDSLQKAKTCLNLIKINYLNNHPEKAIDFLKLTKANFATSLSYKEKYELLFLEARIALTRGLTAKAENLIITRALPMSSKVKGRLNEFNCYLFLGKIYLKAKQLTQAKWFFIQANSIAVNQNYVTGKIETSLLLAKTKIKVGDKAVALQDLAKAKRLIDGRHQVYMADLNQLTRLANR